MRQRVYGIRLLQYCTSSRLVGDASLQIAEFGPMHIASRCRKVCLADFFSN